MFQVWEVGHLYVTMSRTFSMWDAAVTVVRGKDAGRFLLRGSYQTRRRALAEINAVLYGHAGSGLV